MKPITEDTHVELSHYLRKHLSFDDMFGLATGAPTCQSCIEMFMFYQLCREWSIDAKVFDGAPQERILGEINAALKKVYGKPSASPPPSA